ncbi:MAG TPA: hypothetical protein DER04_02085 [Holosporales bacterium]|nr:MAG: hypothetical protein A3G78_07475 [Alphaproteobacteria bacterium RIFCSPLOWO2_12_FULL_42_29]HCE95542.1 hypothetical protein [Holosporales bacterium]
MYYLNDISVLTEDVLIREAAFEKKDLKRRKAVYSFQGRVYQRLKVEGLGYFHKKINLLPYISSDKIIYAISSIGNSFFIFKD